MRKLIALLVLVLAVVGVVAQDAPTIAELVVASTEAETPEFTVLLTAVAAADPAVLEALSNPEAELTVFAPTDAAFGALIEALGQEAFDAIVADTAALTEILLFHVVEGVVMSGDVVALLEANEGAFSGPSLQGQYIDVTQTEEGIFINGAALNLEMVDIEAANGVIHVIDAVILPETRTIAEIVVASTEAETPEFSVLLAAVAAADPTVLEALSNPEAELTVFAPTDAAFAVALEALGLTAEELLADTETLTAVLLYHVVDGTVSSGDLVEALGDMTELTVTMLDGNEALISFTEDGVFINEAQIIITDIDAGNGVIHVIDAVILPPSGE